MKSWSLRTKLMLWVAALVTGTLLLFGGLTAWNLYEEEMEALQEVPRKPRVTDEDIKKEADDIIGDLIQSYAISLPCAVIVAAFGVWFLTKKALQPVKDMAEAAEQIHARALDQRLPQPSTKDEIGKLASILNSLFERLEKSFAQSSRFSADASHELKTPLTIMRAEIESALKRDSADKALLESLLDQTQRISGITSKLLLLARADAGQLQPEKTRIDISALCAELIEDAEILAAERGVQVESDLDPKLEIKGDELLIRQALLNLLDNAIKYNFQDGKVRVNLRKSGQGVAIEVSNTGPGIPAAHVPRIFERFYRPDPSRSSATGGSGLGLSICREIVVAHGGQIKLDCSREGWTSFLVGLPANSQTGRY